MPELLELGLVVGDTDVVASTVELGLADVARCEQLGRQQRAIGRSEAVTDELPGEHVDHAPAEDAGRESCPYRLGTIAQRLQRNACMQAVGGLIAGLLISGLLAAGSIFTLSASGMLLVVIGSAKALAPLAFLGGSALLVAPYS